MSCCPLLYPITEQKLSKNQGLSNCLLTWVGSQGHTNRVESNLRSGSGWEFQNQNYELREGPIYLVPAECCGGWHGCSKFRATPNKVQGWRCGRNYFVSGKEWSAGSPRGLGSVSAWPGGMIRCGTTTTGRLCSLCHGVCWSSEFSSAHRCLCQSTGVA